MRVETNEVNCFSIYDAEGLDTITVVMHDIGEGKGRLIVECYGQAWASYWGGMGNHTVASFVSRCDLGYLVNNLARSGPKLTKAKERYLRLICAAVKEALSETTPRG